MRFSAACPAASAARRGSRGSPRARPRGRGGTLTGITGLYAWLHGKPFIFSVANDRDLDGCFVKNARPHQAALYRIGVRLASVIVIQSEYQARLLHERWGRE